MVVHIDPSGEEKRALLEFTGDLTDQRVLEIGCGDGRLTRQYAALAGHVIAIDPDGDRIAQAQQTLPSELASRVTLSSCDLEAFSTHERFDLAILARSL